MLGFQHLLVDNLPSKCCFSSTMKRQSMRLLAGILATTALYSCATYDGPNAATDSSSMPYNAPAERPGLATGWGDQKNSPIHNRSFVRTSNKPAGIDTIHYNDPQGIKAMGRQATRVEGMQTAAGELVEWGIKGRSGFLPAYKNGWGYDRRLVEGKRGSTYTIHIRNRSKSTLEIVASVDGLDVQDGKPASYSKRGYLVDPGKTLEIDGFRTSHDHVAAFEFSSVANSYANLRHGNPRNVGVIGIAVFTQKGVHPWTWMPREVQDRNTAQAFAEAP